MDIRKLVAEGHTEEIERQLLDLDSQFSFSCQKCGKCCEHQNSILISPRDIFYIAKKLQITPKEVIEKYAETYIGSASKSPVIRMVPRGKNEACPFLKDGLCAIHDCRPTVCALFPLTRMVISKIALNESQDESDLDLEVKYMLSDIDCGSGKRVYTVREWLAHSGIPEQDEFFLLWSGLSIRLRGMISKLEEKHASDVALDFFWTAIYKALYEHYDTSKEFLPQSRQATETLTVLCKETIKTMDRFPD